MISNTAQINTFYGGMNMDSDAAILPNNQYRYGQDVRIITPFFIHASPKSLHFP